MANNNTNHSVGYNMMNTNTTKDNNGKIILIPATIILVLSMIILLFLIVSTTFISELRTGRPQRILSKFVFANHCFSVFCCLMTFVSGFHGNSKFHNGSGCMITSIFLHYFILMTFMWNLSEAIVAYLLFVKMLGLNFTGYRWIMLGVNTVLPLLPVIIVLSINLNTYGEFIHICWLEVTMVYLSIALPSVVVAGPSLILLIIVNVILCKSSHIPQARKTSKRLTKRIIKIALGIVFNGLTWMFCHYIQFQDLVIFYYLMAVSTLLYSLVLFKRSLDKLSLVYWKSLYYRINTPVNTTPASQQQTNCELNAL